MYGTRAVASRANGIIGVGNEAATPLEFSAISVGGGGWFCK